MVPRSKYKKADLFLCPKCRRVYEIVKRHGNELNLPKYHTSIPSYGLEKIICPDCIRRGKEKPDGSRSM